MAEKQKVVKTHPVQPAKSGIAVGKLPGHVTMKRALPIKPSQKKGVSSR